MNDKFHNPYAPPTTTLDIQADDNSGGVHRYGKQIIFVPLGQDLPHRCVNCNQPVRSPMAKQTFYVTRHYSTATFIIGFIMLIMIGKPELTILIVVLALFVEVLSQRKIRIGMGLCDSHQSKKLKLALLWFMSVLISFILGIYAGRHHHLMLQIIAFFCIALSFVGHYLTNKPLNRFIKCRKIDEQGSYLSGFGKEFLLSIAFKKEK